MEGGDRRVSSIDQRIVEMKFDNKQFEKGIQTSLSSLSELKNGLKFDKIKNGINETAESVKNLAHQFTLFGQIALKVKDTIADLVVNRGKQLVKSLSIDQVSSGWTKYGQKTASVQTIMNARSILVVANGEKKAQAVHDMCFGPVTPQCPASILQLHTNVTVVADDDALALCKDKLA